MRMRGYGFDSDLEASARPRGDRIEQDDVVALGRAALAGRTDVLGSAGLLGLQRMVGNAGVATLAEEERSPVHDVINSGGGSPLDAESRADMEARFGGQDFSDVRVHNDIAAHESAKSVNAQAYTVGSDVVFQRDLYDPASESGKHMLAHELTHVVQQRNGPVDGTHAGGGVKVSDPSDRFEREAVANADRVMSTPAPGGPPVQRCPGKGDEDEAEMQTFVQRAADEDEVEEGAS